MASAFDTAKNKRRPIYKCQWRCGDPRCPMAMPIFRKRKV